MSYVTRTACKCDQCGQEWLMRPYRGVLKEPVRCPNHKCKSRQWNKGAKLKSPR